MSGRGAVRETLAATLPEARPAAWRLAGPPKRNGADLYADVAFETATAWGAGRLTPRRGKAQRLLTLVADLRGYEEPEDRTGRSAKTIAPAPCGRIVPRRGIVVALGWRERTSPTPSSLARAGSQLAHASKPLGVPALIVEKQARVGDSWRSRYRSLVLHDAIWHDHMPYLAFPECWPVFPPKGKLGDWPEAYALALNLEL